MTRSQAQCGRLATRLVMVLHQPEHIAHGTLPVRVFHQRRYEPLQLSADPDRLTLETTGRREAEPNPCHPC